MIIILLIRIMRMGIRIIVFMILITIRIVFWGLSEYTNLHAGMPLVFLPLLYITPRKRAPVIRGGSLWGDYMNPKNWGHIPLLAFLSMHYMCP